MSQMELMFPAMVCETSSWRHPDVIRTGTTAGYAAHKKAGEQACEACLIAQSVKSAQRRGYDSEEYRRYRSSLEKYRERIAQGEKVLACERPTRRRPEGRTGTGDGWQAHYYDREPPCDACLKGHVIDQAAYKAARPEADLRMNLFGKYKLSLDEYRAKLQAQDGKCAICGVASPTDIRTNRFHVDHDHRCCPGYPTCGECTRGLLCHACNTALGNFKDDPDILMSAVAYLLSYTSVLEVVSA